MNIHIITLFPSQLQTMVEKGIVLRALEKKKFTIQYHDLRVFAEPPHNKVDDYPFGKKRGMLLKVDVLDRAIQSIPNYASAKIVYPCPKGQHFTQGKADQLAESKDIILICGYYEGLDERIFDLYEIERISMGDFILTSGELPSLIIVDTLVRNIDGVLGNPDSVRDDSILTGVLEHPQYTHPRSYKDLEVPEVITSGNHKLREAWERQEQLKATLQHRPDLLANANLTEVDKTTIKDQLV